MITYLTAVRVRKICGFMTLDMVFTGGRIYNTKCSLVVAGHPKKPSGGEVPFKGYMDQVRQHYVSQPHSSCLCVEKRRHFMIHASMSADVVLTPFNTS